LCGGAQSHDPVNGSSMASETRRSRIGGTWRRCRRRRPPPRRRRERRGRSSQRRCSWGHVCPCGPARRRTPARTRRPPRHERSMRTRGARRDRRLDRMWHARRHRLVVMEPGPIPRRPSTRGSRPADGSNQQRRLRPQPRVEPSRCPALYERSGRLRRVLASAASRRHRSISAWLPPSSTSGTAMPRNSRGRV
jgi:hypothetical protein